MYFHFLMGFSSSFLHYYHFENRVRSVRNAAANYISNYSSLQFSCFNCSSSPFKTSENVSFTANRSSFSLEKTTFLCFALHANEYCLFLSLRCHQKKEVTCNAITYSDYNQSRGIGYSSHNQTGQVNHNLSPQIRSLWLPYLILSCHK